MASRRRFIQWVGGAGLALAGCRGRDGSQAAAGDARPPRRDSGAGSVPRRVAIVRDRLAVDGDGGVDGARVAAMLEKGMAALSAAGGGAASTWRALFRAEDVVAIKVNCLGGPRLSTHPEVARAVAEALHAHAGIPLSRVLAYDRQRRELIQAGFTDASAGCRVAANDEEGYDVEPTVWGAAGSCFSRIVSTQASAIVNAPILKDHDLVGVSGALKNHFGSIHNPNKMHTDHACPYVADVNRAPHLYDKHRLVVCDALRVCYDGGPGYKPDTTLSYGALLVGVDPVAVDVVAFGILEKLRKEHGLKPIAGSEREPKYLRVAADAEHRLGIFEREKIEVKEIG